MIETKRLLFYLINFVLKGKSNMGWSWVNARQTKILRNTSINILHAKESGKKSIC